LTFYEGLPVGGQEPPVQLAHLLTKAVLAHNTLMSGPAAFATKVEGGDASAFSWRSRYAIEAELLREWRTMAGTDRQRENITGGPAIILMEPQLGENIGMVARAMANFGLSNLRIVSPRDGWPNEKAISAASRADHVINAAVVFDTLEEALADLNFVYATTARPRDGHKTVRGPVEAGETLRARESRGETTGILFGRERIGLRNAEVGLADEIVTFPVNPAYASLNIAQAVLLMSYEWMKSGLTNRYETAFEAPEAEPAPKSDLHGLFGQIEEGLDARGYFRSEDKRMRAIDNLRAVLTRPGFSTEEINVLRGVFASFDRFDRKGGRRPGVAAKPGGEETGGPS
jgi:tRNA/rRNA methyltransferase